MILGHSILLAGIFQIKFGVKLRITYWGLGATTIPNLLFIFMNNCNRNSFFFLGLHLFLRKIISKTVLEILKKK